MENVLAIPEPGTALVPDGWWRSTVMPWADSTEDTGDLRLAAAQLDALIAAYRTMNADTLELQRGRRYLEIRWGELLGPGERGQPGRSNSQASELDKDERYRFRKLAGMRDLAMERLESAVDADEVTRTALLKIAHVGENTGENEWYTSPEIIKAVVLTMGGIDLDPASTPEANRIVQATKFYTKADDGLAQPWADRVFMNPPYAQPLINLFTSKLIDDYKSDNVTEACVLVNNASDTAWFTRLSIVASARCDAVGRGWFWHPDRVSAPLQGQTIWYFGDNALGFVEAFARIGVSGLWAGRYIS